MRLLPPTIRHRVTCSAPPGDVWAILGEPRRWPEFEPLLRRVRGAGGQAVAGQRLLAIGRGLAVPVPVDVHRVVPRQALDLTVYLAPGLRSHVQQALAPTAKGGTQILIVVRLDGLFAPSALLPLWFSTGVSARLLARGAEREHRRRRKADPGVA